MMNYIPAADLLELSRLACEKSAEKYAAVKEAAVSCYKAIETGTVSGYQAIENAVVGTYTKIEDSFVDTFLKHGGETVAEAKARLRAASQTEEKQNECH